MSRFRYRKPAVSVQLFPFLAVLICTMGALIVLLVLVVQQARVQADTITAQRKHAEQDQDQQRTRLLEEQQEFEWQQEILQQQREELQAQLAQRRLALSHLEDHIRRLDRKWRQLLAEIDQLRKTERGGGQDIAAAQQQLAVLRAELETERSRLDAARAEAARRQRSFAIIPYQGPNGTRRRPIYIECRESAIVVQPEGVVLQPQDFAGPLGPGNPLDAALRCIREYWATAEGQARLGEPYPLLVVRPDGAVAYAVARAAMSNWDDEFGYELIDAELVLDFPPSDPLLRNRLQEAVLAARQRQAILAAAMPSRFGAGRGGDVFTLPDGTGGGEPGAAGGGAEAEGYGPPSIRGSYGRPTGAAAAGSGNGPAGSSPANPLRTPSAPGAGAEPRGPARPSAAGHPPNGQAAETAGTQGPRGPQSSPATPGGQAAEGAAGTGAGAGSPGGRDPGGAGISCPADSKGVNWALPRVAAQSTGITRPIAVEVYPDRLVLLPERGEAGSPVVVPLPGSTRAALDPFVAAVWTHMERWGMAVAGGYWKPVLKVQVAPGAETRFADLDALLRDSGMVVERRAAPTPQVQP